MPSLGMPIPTSTAAAAAPCPPRLDQCQIALLRRGEVWRVDALTCRELLRGATLAREASAAISPRESTSAAVQAVPWVIALAAIVVALAR